jgi:hypothetical protein
MRFKGLPVSYQVFSVKCFFAFKLSFEHLLFFVFLLYQIFGDLNLPFKFSDNRIKLLSLLKSQHHLALLCGFELLNLLLKVTHFELLFLQLFS